MRFKVFNEWINFIKCFLLMYWRTVYYWRQRSVLYELIVFSSDHIAILIPFASSFCVSLQSQILSGDLRKFWRLIHRSSLHLTLASALHKINIGEKITFNCGYNFSMQMFKQSSWNFVKFIGIRSLSGLISIGIVW